MDKLPDQVLLKILSYLPDNKSVKGLSTHIESIINLGKLKYDPKSEVILNNLNLLDNVISLDIVLTEELFNLNFPNLKGLKLTVDEESQLNKGLHFLLNHPGLNKLELNLKNSHLILNEEINSLTDILSNFTNLTELGIKSKITEQNALNLVAKLKGNNFKKLSLHFEESFFGILDGISKNLSELVELSISGYYQIPEEDESPLKGFNNSFLNLQHLTISSEFDSLSRESRLLHSYHFPSLRTISFYSGRTDLSLDLFVIDFLKPDEWIKIESSRGFNSNSNATKFQYLRGLKKVTGQVSAGKNKSPFNFFNLLGNLTKLDIIYLFDDIPRMKKAFTHLPHLTELTLFANTDIGLFYQITFPFKLTFLKLLFTKVKILSQPTLDFAFKNCATLQYLCMTNKFPTLKDMGPEFITKVDLNNLKKLRLDLKNQNNEMVTKLIKRLPCIIWVDINYPTLETNFKILFEQIYFEPLFIHSF